MMFKHAAVAASLGLLFAGHALAVANGGFSQPGLTGRDTLGDVAGSFGGGARTTSSLDHEDGLPDAPATYDASGIAAAEVGVPGGAEEFSGLAISVAPVPEPKDWLLLMLAGIGLVGLMVGRNRRRPF